MTSNYITYSDEQLLALLKESDGKAFDTIYYRYWKPLFFIAVKKINDLQFAEEILQDLFINLWERKADLMLSVKLSTYLIAAVKYKIINALIKQKSQKSSSVRLGLEIEADQLVNPFTDYLEFQDQLSHNLSQLPERCRVVFRLSKQEGFSHKEIANHLNISEKTVEYHLTKAVKLLRSGFGCVLFSILLIISLFK